MGRFEDIKGNFEINWPLAQCNSIRNKILVSYASFYSIDMIMYALNKLDYLNMLFESIEVPYIYPFRNKIKSIEDKALHKKIVS